MFCLVFCAFAFGLDVGVYWLYWLLDCFVGGLVLRFVVIVCL